MKMKSFLTAVLFIMTTAFSVNAQKVSQTLTSLLNSYYEIKNALVNSDAATTSVKAGEFIKTSDSIDIKTIPADEMNAFMSLVKKLVSGAENIAGTKDINKQRDYFAGFSLDFYSMAKMVKLSDQPVYKAYCPMKKMYWLSNEKTIKNPYYGKKMLNCGSITETIDP
jgi:hypothetical protein